MPYNDELGCLPTINSILVTLLVKTSQYPLKNKYNEIIFSKKVIPIMTELNLLNSFITSSFVFLESKYVKKHNCKKIYTNNFKLTVENLFKKIVHTKLLKNSIPIRAECVFNISRRFAKSHPTTTAAHKMSRFINESTKTIKYGIQ